MARDSLHVNFSNFASHLGTISYYIDSGDSVFLVGNVNLFGGSGPVSYIWQPGNSLSDSTLHDGGFGPFQLRRQTIRLQAQILPDVKHPRLEHISFMSTLIVLRN